MDVENLQVEDALYGLEGLVLRYGIARAAGVRSGGRAARAGSLQGAAPADTPAAAESEITERVVRCGAASADFSGNREGVLSVQTVVVPWPYSWLSVLS